MGKLNFIRAILSFMHEVPAVFMKNVEYSYPWNYLPAKAFTLIFLVFFLNDLQLFAQAYTGSFDLISTQNYSNGNVRKDTVGYYFGKGKTAILIYGRGKDPDMRLVFSPNDKTITSLFEMNGKKGGFILPMDEAHWPGMVQAFRSFGAVPDKPLNYSGQQKTIEGFLCKEVLAENEEYTANLWVTEDLPLSMTRILSYQSVGKGKANDEIELFDQLGVIGLPVKLFLKSKTGKADVEIHLVNFKNTVTASIFSEVGHTLSKIE